MNFDDDVFKTRVRLPPGPPKVSIMLFSRPGSLARMLRRASHLALSDDFVRFMRSYDDRFYALPEKIYVWAQEMFCMGPDRRYDDDVGTIAHWMRTEYPELFDDLLELSNKLEQSVYKQITAGLTATDWDLMQNGIEQYRRHLINTPDHCECY